MIAGLVETLEVIIRSLGVWGVLAASFIEEIVAPLPSPVVMTTSGFFLLEGDLSLQFIFTLVFGVAIPYGVGVTLGSFFLYGIFRVFGEDAVRRWGSWFGISWSKVEDIKKKMDRSRWDEATLFFLRVIPIVPSAVLASVSGLIKMNFLKYTLITLIGVTLRACMFASLGWYLGEAYRKYAKTVGEIESIIGYGFLFLSLSFLIIMFIYTQARRKNVIK
ncbi:MAG: DedA family protein [Patescibacteria group bacterium]